jgi:transposase
MRIYRAKDVVGKGFLRLKRNLDLGRLRVHFQDRMLNKVFVGFIALILLSEINKVMSEKSLYRTMTMQQLIRCLSKLICSSRQKILTTYHWLPDLNGTGDVKYFILHISLTKV